MSGQTEIQSNRGDRQRYIARVGTYRDREQEWGHTEIQSIGGDIQRYRVREGTDRDT